MKKLLLVIDYQNDFIDGSLGFSKAKNLSEGIKQKIITCRKSGYDIWFTQDEHDKNYLQTREGKILPIAHCVKGTHGFELHKDIKDVMKSNDRIFYKSTFGSLNLANHLSQCNYEEIELVGLVTNICVISNAVLVKSALPETEITVDSRLCASYDDDLHVKSLDVLRGLQINII